MSRRFDLCLKHPSPGQKPWFPFGNSSSATLLFPWLFWIRSGKHPSNMAEIGCSVDQASATKTPLLCRGKKKLKNKAWDPSPSWVKKPGGLWHISRILLRKNLRWGQCMFICPPDQTWRTINWMSSRYQLSNCPCIRMPMHQTNKYQNCNIQWGYLVCNVGKWRRDIYIDMYILWIYTYVIICVYIYIQIGKYPSLLLYVFWPFTQTKKRRYLYKYMYT